MLCLLFTIASYGAILLLLMSASVKGIILMAAEFALGAVLIVCRRAHRIALRKNAARLIPLALPMTAALGFSFYKRWISSSKMQVLADMLHMPISALLLIASLILSVLSVYFLCIFLRTISKWLARLQNDFIRDLSACILVAALCVILAQLMVGADAFSMGCIHFVCGVLIVSVVILLLYAILGRMTPSILCGAGIFMLLSTINAYVYIFRERLFEPVDIFSVGTAMNVAESYSLLPIPAEILLGWIAFIAICAALDRVQRKTAAKPAVRKRLCVLAVCAVASCAIFFYAADLKTYHWHREGAQFNGYILDFVSKFKEISAQEPDHYGAELVDQLSEQYAAGGDADSATEPSVHPHIIVIMDEAFSDLSIAGEFSTNAEVSPFISSLKENTISGYALVSVCGGNTANSEYEFLTGNSMAWLSPNAVPYQQYIGASTYSMVSYLKSSCNYKCIAMHPFEDTGWNRLSAYEYLGFDECYFVEDFPQSNYVREYISDREMFEFLIETYEAQKDEPLFLFGVTMQNHGDYTYTGENYTQYISLSDYGDEFPEVEQYLSLLRETDQAVEYLIGYFENVDEDVMIVFFGDHQPKISDSFLEAVSGMAADTLDAQQQRYKVPFFIWTNYEIEAKTIDCIGLNYLSSYVYDAAGIDLPPYNRFLREMEGIIPSMNANGFYATSAGCYLPFDEADGDYLRYLELYEILQYNSLFDAAHRSEIFFPTAE